MLLFFIYAALGVELFGRLGEWGQDGAASPTHGLQTLWATGHTQAGSPAPQPFAAQGEHDSGHTRERCQAVAHMHTHVHLDVHTRVFIPSKEGRARRDLSRHAHSTQVCVWSAEDRCCSMSSKLSPRTSLTHLAGAGGDPLW